MAAIVFPPDLSKRIAAYEPSTIEDLGLTPFPQAMPDVYKVPGDAVAAYRRFYIGEKASFATWTKRPIPTWFRQSGIGDA